MNVAARLQALSEPGEICVSASVREQVGEKLPIGFADMGEHSVKNIARPVHVFRVETRGETTVSHLEKPPLALPDRPSIAALPFTNMSGDAEQDYFADGMVEDIITGLSRIKWLFVIARNSTFIYKGKPVDVKRVARELGVRYVLEGSVRKSANRVRITGQLIEAETGRHVWAERYDRTLDDIFALQDEITISVVGAIEPNLRQAEIERIRRYRPDSIDAYDLVLRALPHAYLSMPDEAMKALALLERSLTIEPNYALAHGLAAWCREILFTRAGFGAENRTAAMQHASAAITYGRDDAMALALAGFVLGIVGPDHSAASEAFEELLVLSPSSAITYIFGSVIMGWAGHAERAIEWGERALRLSPFDPLAYAACIALTLGHFQNGRYEQAASAARKGLQSNPGFSLSFQLLAATLVKLGRVDEAKAVASHGLTLEPGFTVRGLCAALAAAPVIAGPLSEAMRVAGLPE